MPEHALENSKVNIEIQRKISFLPIKLSRVFYHYVYTPMFFDIIDDWVIVDSTL